MKYTTDTIEEKELFEVGKEYYTYYMWFTTKANKFQNYVPVFKTKLLEKIDTGYGIRLEFEIPASLKLSDLMNHNLRIYMDGYGLSSCDFYDTEKEAQLAHDEQIIEHCKNQDVPADDRDKMFKKLHHYKPTPSKMEVAAKAWLESLNETERQYFTWLKYNTK